MEKQADISELIQLMFVGLMGANNEIEKVIKKFYERYDKASHGFLFLEYLLHQPLHKESSCDDVWEVSPFTPRLASKSLVMIRPEDASGRPDFKPSNNESIAQADIVIKMNDTMHTNYVYKYWKERRKYETQRECDNRLEFKDLFEEFDEGTDRPFFAISKNIQEDFVSLTQNDGWREFSNKHPVSMKSFHVLYGLLWPHIERLGPNDLSAFFIPIASSAIFYGVLFVLVPQFNKDSEINRLMQLAHELLKCVKKHYVPALALIHEHFFEKRVGSELKEEDSLFGDKYGERILKEEGQKLLRGKEPFFNPICRRGENDEITCYSCEYFGWEESSDNVVEKYLHKLWQERFTGRIGIKKSLIFSRFFNTDPKTLELYEDFLKPSKAKLDKDRDLLPSVLVVAPPGSGKESIPKLLKLFSDCYSRGEIYKLNMASLKPDAAVPALMVGGEIAWVESIFSEGRHKEKQISQGVRLMGILQEIRERTRNEFLEFLTEKDKGIDEEAKDYKNNLKRLINTKLEKIKPGVKKIDSLTAEQKIEFDSIKLTLPPKPQTTQQEKEEIKNLENIFKELAKELKESIREPNAIERHRQIKKAFADYADSLEKVETDEEIKTKLADLKKKLRGNLEDIEKKLKDKKDLKRCQIQTKDVIELIQELKHVKSLVDKLENNEEKNIKTLIDELREDKEVSKKQNEPIIKLYENEKGLFEELKLGEEEKLIIKKLFRKFPVLVLDELNSMTIESQGVLLRFLENAEIVPIGGYEDRMTYGEEKKDYREFLTDFLVVGLMNEPEEITREEAVRFLKQKGSYISGFLGDILYEHILRMRRLRPDLRQRMMRNGKLQIPPVEERRADIPIAFYLNINDIKGNYFVRSDIRVNMGALEYLMSPGHEWPENFRLVETLSKKVLEIVYEDYEEKRFKGEPIFQIDGKDLIIVREKHIKKAMEAIGMIKEKGVVCPYPWCRGS